MYNPFSLAGKTILVTGASSGIGRATAVESAKMGASLVVTGRNEGRLQDVYETLEGEGHRKVIADLSCQEGIDALVADLPPLDGAVLCAGITKNVPVQFATREKFNSIFDVNFFSPVELLRQLYRGKKLNLGASVAVVASIGGLRSFNYGNGLYGSSKAALVSFMKYCAHEFAGRKIRVNCVCPGMIETPMRSSTPYTQEQLDKYMERIPLKRFGQPEEVAFGIIYLLSEASSYVTGMNLFIDGGGES